MCSGESSKILIGSSKVKDLEEPLEKVAHERLKIESYRMQILGQDSVMDAPYLLPREDEIAFLVSRQLKEDILDDKLAEQEKITNI